MNNEQYLKKASNFLISTLAVLSVLAVYFLIVMRLNRGTSCDEGFYLQGYLPHQTVHFGVSDFHSIVKSFLPALPADYALSLRYLRFFATIISLFLFAWSSCQFFQTRYNVALNKIVYFSLVFLAGAIGFCFASPVLYYDNIQAIIYFLTFAAFFAYLHGMGKTFFAHTIGFLFVFGLANYLPSGLLLGFSIIVLALIYNELNIKNTFFVLSGFLFGLLFYHFAIHNIFDLINQIINALQMAQQDTTGHSNSELLQVLFVYFFDAAKMLALPLLLMAVFLFLNRFFKNKILKISGLIIVFCLSSFVFVLKINTAYTTLFLLPIFYVLFVFLLNNKVQFSKKTLKPIAITTVFLAIPIMGVFGTNQNISAKMDFFMPFLVVLAVFLLLETKIFHNNFQRNFVTLWLVLFFVAGYVFLGYFTRYQYYYTPKKSTQMLENVVNMKNIKFAPQQKQFIENAISLMRENGFQEKDEMLSFGENQIVTYAASGTIAGNFVYHIIDFVMSSENIPKNKVKFILINQNEERQFIDFLDKSDDWHFPDNYQRYDLGKYAENMPDSLNTILYIANTNDNSSSNGI